MPLTPIGTSADGGTLFRATGDDLTDLIFLKGDDDLRTTTETGFIQGINGLFGSPGDNEVIVRSDVSSVRLAPGDDSLTVTDDGNVNYAAMDDGNDTVVISDSGDVAFIEMGDGDDSLTLSGNAGSRSADFGDGNDSLTVEGDASSKPPTSARTTTPSTFPGLAVPIYCSLAGATTS